MLLKDSEYSLVGYISEEHVVVEQGGIPEVWKKTLEKHLSVITIAGCNYEYFAPARKGDLWYANTASRRFIVAFPNKLVFVKGVSRNGMNFGNSEPVNQWAREFGKDFVVLDESCGQFHLFDKKLWDHATVVDFSDI